MDAAVMREAQLNILTNLFRATFILNLKRAETGILPWFQLSSSVQSV